MLENIKKLGNPPKNVDDIEKWANNVDKNLLNHLDGLSGDVEIDVRFLLRVCISYWVNIKEYESVKELPGSWEDVLKEIELYIKEVI